MASDQLVKLARAFQQAFDAYLQLVAAVRQASQEDLSGLKDLINPTVLVEMVKNRILPSKAFEALLAIDHEQAIHVLFQRFLGNNNPDRCYGGFTYDVSLMLHHLRSLAGDEGVRNVLNNPSFNRELLKDERFLQAITDALDINETDFSSWLQRNEL